MRDILDILLYFAKFVTLDVREKQIIKGDRSAYANYASFAEELRAVPETEAFPEIRNFIFSSNEDFVSNSVPNAKGGPMLFVEYGNVNLDKENTVDKTEVLLSVTVASELSTANSDMIEEALAMQQNYDLLKSIINKMSNDYDSLENCPDNEIIIFPAEIYPIEPKKFYGHGGWVAMFKRRR